MPIGVGNVPDSAVNAPVQIEARNLRKVFARRSGVEALAIDDVSFKVAKGEFVVLLGPSGCGKSTLLRCIAGLERPTSGEILLGDNLVSSPQKKVHVQPENRNISMMFQSYAIWPHMTVAQNIAYPLKLRGKSNTETRTAVDEILNVVNLAGLGGEYPGQLSGGQQQRVGLARSLVMRPNVVLFDEPLSNVDAKVRRLLRRELVIMQRKFGFAGLYVTHDQEEAMQIADRIILMREGKVAQSGTPQQVFNEPTSKYAASFFGEINEVEGTVMEVSLPAGQDLALATVRTALGVMRARILATVAKGQTVTVVTRPHQMQIAADSSEKGEPETNVVTGRVIRQVTSGIYTEYVVEAAGILLTAWAMKALPSVGPDNLVRISFEPADARIFPADSAE